MPTVEQLQFLNGLLAMFANDYKAEAGDETGGVKVTFQMGNFERRIDCGLTIDPSEEDDGKWTVNTIVESGGSRDYPPDVDLVEVAPPCSWEQACAALVRAIVEQTLENALALEGEKQFAKDLEDSDAWLDQDFDPNDMP